jgi:hypothetical protein
MNFYTSCIKHHSVINPYEIGPHNLNSLALGPPDEKENGMTDKDKFAHRLALLEGVNFSPADLEAIVAEIEDLERVVSELEEFSQDTPWITQQVQPADKKV